MNRNETLKDLFHFASPDQNQRKSTKFHSLLVQTITDTVKSHSFARKICQTSPYDSDGYLIGNYGGAVLPTFMPTKVTYAPPKETSEVVSDKKTSFCSVEYKDGTVWIPLFKLSTSWDCHVSDIEREDFLVVKKMMSSCAKSIIDYENENFFRLLVPSATSHVQTKNGKTICRNFQSDECFNIGLLTRMYLEMEKFQGRKMSHVLISSDLAKQIKGSHLKKLPKVELKNGATITLIEFPQIGVDKRYSIVAKETIFKIKENNKKIIEETPIEEREDKYESLNEVPIFTTEECREFNDYYFNDKYPQQIYGLDLVDNSFIMPIKQDLYLWNDSQLHREQKFGFYGWEEIGMACLDLSAVAMASLPDNCEIGEL